MKKQIVLNHQPKDLLHLYFKVPLNPPNNSKYQLDSLDIHTKLNTASPTSPDLEIDMVYIKETTESPASPNSAVILESISKKEPFYQSQDRYSFVCQKFSSYPQVPDQTSKDTETTTILETTR